MYLARVSVSEDFAVNVDAYQELLLLFFLDIMSSVDLDY